MMPQQPPTPQDRPPEYPLHPDGSSLLVLFGMALLAPVVLWALAEPLHAGVIVTIVVASVVLARAVRRFRRADHAFHVPGTQLDVEITVRRSSSP